MMPSPWVPSVERQSSWFRGVWLSSRRGELGGLAGEQANSVLAHRRAYISQHRRAKGKGVARHVWTCDSSAD
jgi:hypothetical protein